MIIKIVILVAVGVTALLLGGNYYEDRAREIQEAKRHGQATGWIPSWLYAVLCVAGAGALLVIALVVIGAYPNLIAVFGGGQR